MYEVVVIGVSAGGMDALDVLIPRLPPDFRLPVIVVQHRCDEPDTFLSDRLNERSAITVTEARGKEPIHPATVYLAPAGYHLLVEEERTFSLSMDLPVNHSRPSIDVLFESAADVYEDRLVGVILTGASSDGSRGLKRIGELGGLTVVQSPGSAEFDFMPRAALEAVPVDHILDLDGIAKLLCGFQ